MNVTFYNFSKRRNSTKQPTGTGTVLDCKLKEGTSIKNPKIQIAGRNFGYDYAYIADFGRYYFVTDVISDAYDLTTYELEEDSLATNKTAIGNTVARIGFAATGWNKWIPDSRIAVKTSKNITAVSTTTDFSSIGCYILTTFTGASAPSNGLGTSFVMDLAGITLVHNYMGDPTMYQKLVNFFMGNPLDAIFGCIFVPFHKPNAPASSGTVHIGDQDLGISADVLQGTGLYEANTYYITLPHRYNDFRDYEPYTSAQIYLPGVGCTDINLSDYEGASQIAIKTVFEYGTGDVTYYLSPDSAGSNIVQSFTVNCASQCPLGQTTSSVGGALGGASGMVGGLGTMIAGIATENAATVLAGAGATLVSAANTAIQSNKRGTSLKGGAGGRTSTLKTSITLIVFSMDTEDCDAANYIATKGRPVALSHAINTHSGFVMCDDASVSISGDSWERDEINSYLNSGFFYE